MHKINRFVQKVALKIYRATQLERVTEVTEYERAGVNICRKLLSKPDSILLISPISGKRYIKSEDSSIFIVIEEFTISIVNHQYSYSIRISDKSRSKISIIFDREVESRRNIMELEIKSNVKHSLETIYKNLSDENI